MTTSTFQEEILIVKRLDWGLGKELDYPYPQSQEMTMQCNCVILGATHQPTTHDRDGKYK